MELVVGDQAMWHTTLCLSTYFVSVALDGATSGHNVCKTLAWEKFLKQMGVTFMMLQRNLQEVDSSNTQDLIVKTSRMMGSMIQLQRFEISVGNLENCRKHLGAAITLFRQIFLPGCRECHRPRRAAYFLRCPESYGTATLDYNDPTERSLELRSSSFPILLGASDRRRHHRQHMH